jgi:hypothetical protein
VAPRISTRWFRQGWQSEAVPDTWSQGHKMVLVALYILLAVCDHFECVVFDQPFSIVYWYTRGVDCFVFDAMGRAEVVDVGAVEYEDYSSYRKSWSRCLVDQD